MSSHYGHPLLNADFALKVFCIRSVVVYRLLPRKGGGQHALQFLPIFEPMCIYIHIAPVLHGNFPSSTPVQSRMRHFQYIQGSLASDSDGWISIFKVSGLMIDNYSFHIWIVSNDTDVHGWWQYWWIILKIHSYVSIHETQVVCHGGHLGSSFLGNSFTYIQYRSNII